MTSLQSWLSKPRATVRIDTTVPWAAWMKVLQRPFIGKQSDRRARIEVLDRLSLGGKKSLMLISIEGRRMLVGVGEDAAPSISVFDEIRGTSQSRFSARNPQILRRRKVVRP